MINGDAIRLARVNARMTQEALAQAVRQWIRTAHQVEDIFSNGAISKYERGAVDDLPTLRLLGLCAVLGLDQADIITENVAPLKDAPPEADDGPGVLFTILRGWIETHVGDSDACHRAKAAAELFLDSAEMWTARVTEPTMTQEEG